MLALTLLACVGSNECLTHTDCGESQACQGDVSRGEATCQTVECLTSSVCAHGEFCSPETYRCEEGCQRSTDCPVQYTCDAGECVFDATCTDTQRDCAAGETCDLGTCERDFGVCEPCGLGCGDELVCVEYFCLPTCSTQADCPSGLTCWSGLCYTDCEWMNEYGYM